MRVLLVWAAADWSINDVSQGYKDALEELGHEVMVYNLARRIEWWSRALKHHTDTEGIDMPPVDVVMRYAADWILIEAARFVPDFILVTSAMGFHPDAMVLLRNQGHKLVFALTESPYDDAHHAEIVPYANYVGVNDLESVDLLQQFTPAPVFYLPTAFNHRVHRPRLEPLPDAVDPEHGTSMPGLCDVIFVGTGFPERQTFLESIPWANLGINFQLHGFWGWMDVNNDVGPRNYPDSPLRALAHPPCTNDETARRYVGAKVVLNMYRKGARYSLNPRAYEIAAVGAFQLAEDASIEAHTIFKDTIAYFPTNDTAALIDALGYWLDPARDVMRREMAEASQRIVTGSHSYVNRTLTLLNAMSVSLTLTDGQKLDWGVSAGVRSGRESEED